MEQLSSEKRKDQWSSKKSNRISTGKRAVEICKELKVTFKILSSYTERLGFVLNTASEKVSPELEEWIHKAHFHNYQGRLPRALVKQQQYSSTHEQPLPTAFSRKNAFADNIVSLTLNKSPFEKRKKERRKIGGRYIDTIFTDFEAYSVCHGLDNRHLNHIARCFFQNKHNDAFTLEAHEWAMSALKDHGPRFLSFILSLPALPFEAFDAGEIFSVLDKRKADQQFPAIRINFEDRDGGKDKIEITFYVEKEGSKRVRNENVLLVKNKTTGQQLMQVSRDGKVVPNDLARDIVPVLQLFVRFSKDTKSMILNYGLDQASVAFADVY